METFVILLIIGFVLIAGGLIGWYVFGRSNSDLSNSPSGSNSGQQGSSGNPMTACINQVISYLNSLPTDVKSFVTTLNSGISLCQDKVVVKMINDTSGEPDTMITFTNGSPDKKLQLANFKSGDLIAFRVCSKLDPCNSGGRVDVWITLG